MLLLGWPDVEHLVVGLLCSLTFRAGFQFGVFLSGPLTVVFVFLSLVTTTGELFGTVGAFPPFPSPWVSVHVSALAVCFCALDYAVLSPVREGHAQGFF